MGIFALPESQTCLTSTNVVFDTRTAIGSGKLWRIQKISAPYIESPKQWAGVLTKGLLNDQFMKLS